jgi:hypothetical protein
VCSSDLFSTVTVTLLSSDPEEGETVSHFASALTVHFILDVTVKDNVWPDGPKSSESVDISKSYDLRHPFMAMQNITVAAMAKVAPVDFSQPYVVANLAFNLILFFMMFDFLPLSERFIIKIFNGKSTGLFFCIYPQKWV